MIGPRYLGRLIDQAAELDLSSAALIQELMLKIGSCFALPRIRTGY